jgi:hypothetical protein
MQEVLHRHLLPVSRQGKLMIECRAKWVRDVAKWHPRYWFGNRWRLRFYSDTAGPITIKYETDYERAREGLSRLLDPERSMGDGQGYY